jgi:hypothetical protein
MTSFCRHHIELTGNQQDIAVVKIMLAMPQTARGTDFDPVAAAREIHSQGAGADYEFSRSNFSLYNIDSPKGEELTLYALSVAGLGDDNYARYWQFEHWGVSERKFDGYLLEESQGRLLYSVTTGWASPWEALIKLSTLFPEVMIKVEWWSENFEWGNSTFLAGEETFSETYGWSTEPFVDREPSRDL